MRDISQSEAMFQPADLGGTPLLFSSEPLLRASIPEGWYVYDLRSSPTSEGRPVTLETSVVMGFAGTVLSPTPLKERMEPRRYLNGLLTVGDTSITLEQFCQEHRIRLDS